MNEWTVRFRKSQDYFQFVSEAMEAAQDGRAALHVSEALETCTHLANSYRDRVDPEAAFLAGLADMTGAQQWVHDAKLEEFRRCRRFFDEDPFVTLLPRPGGYPPRYWRELADGTDDPLVKALHAARESGRYLYDADETAEATRQAIQADLRVAIMSEDPDALYNAGTLLANGGLTADPLRGVAWIILACERGYDCSSRNLTNTFSSCAQIGTCPVDADWSYYLKQRLGEADHARAHAMARKLEKMMAQDDRENLEPYWTLAARHRNPEVSFSSGDERSTPRVEPVP